MYIITIIAIIMLIKYIYKAIKTSESLIEKIIYSLLGSIMIIILIIYYTDRYDIPSIMGWNKNINTQNWLNILGNYITGIIGSIIGASVSLYIMRCQIDENDKNTEKRDKDNLRIQNIPLFKYSCTDGKEINNKMVQLDSVFSEDESVTQSVNLSIKNIGLNTTRRTLLKIKCDKLIKDYLFDYNNYGIIEKNQEVVISLVMRMKTDEVYEFYLTVYYEDLLQNIYEQKALLKYELFSKNDGSNYYYKYNFEVEDEVMINKISEEKFEIL